MAKQSASSKKLGEYRIVNVWLSDAEKTEFELWAKQSSFDQGDSLLSVADGGFKISFSHDSYNDNYVGSLTAKRPVNRKLTNLVFVVRHNDFIKLMALTTYVFIVMLAEGEQMLKNQGSDIDW